MVLAQDKVAIKVIKTRVYQTPMLHKQFAQPLNVGVIVKAHVLPFSSDLELLAEKLIDYYCLRFQIECNFRDAMQYWGLEDFMNVTQTPV